VYTVYRMQSCCDRGTVTVDVPYRGRSLPLPAAVGSLEPAGEVRRAAQALHAHPAARFVAFGSAPLLPPTERGFDPLSEWDARPQLTCLEVYRCEVKPL
jgi:hypothetical protein